MFRLQLRQISRHAERVQLNLLSSSRQFSITPAIAAEGQGQGQPSAPNAAKPRPASAPARTPRPANRLPNAGAPRQPRPAGAVDARSFAAPRTGEQPKIIRRPRMQAIRGGGKPGKGKPKGKGKGRPAQKPKAKRAKRVEVDADDDVQAAAIEQIEKDHILNARPTPVRYEPQEIDFTALRETWPSLPTDANGRTAAVLEKLTHLSGRFPNGYVPPYELGRRMWRGQNVLFENEAEKAEAMQEVKRLAQARADSMSQAKGETVEPRDIKFSAVDAKDTKTLMETFVQGKYPTAEAAKDQPVLSEVVKNLHNNGTYQTSGKRPQFLAKVESLLASSRVKRT